MARVRVQLVQPAAEFEALFADKKTKGTRARSPRAPGMSERMRKQLEAELDAAMATKSAACLRGPHFVIAYERMYADVYEIDVPDFDPKNRLAAAKAAEKMLTEKFGDDPSKFVDYMRFVFTREKSRHEYRKANPSFATTRTISWHFLFKKEALYSDWFVDHKRREHAKAIQ